MTIVPRWTHSAVSGQVDCPGAAGLSSRKLSVENGPFTGRKLRTVRGPSGTMPKIVRTL